MLVLTLTYDKHRSAKDQEYKSIHDNCPNSGSLRVKKKGLKKFILRYNF